MSDGATIDFAALHLVFGGHRVSGYAPGTAISVVYDADRFNTLVGTDGLGAWVKTGNLAATITATILQNSPSNDAMSTFHLADVAAPGGVLLPLAILDNTGRTAFSTDKARIIKLPDTTYADGVESRAWTIRTTRLVGFVGGNSPPAT